MKRFYIIFLILFLFAQVKTNAQGCVAIKGSGTSCMMSHADPSDKPGWQFTTGARYFKSFRHFSGKEENKDRLIQNTEVINHSATLDLA